MGLDKKILPHKRYSGAIKDDHTDRYFVDKFPMFYNPADSFVCHYGGFEGPIQAG